MRELKFRAFHKGANKMVLWNQLRSLRYSIENDQIEVMQYTGLKDKNGVEIYEGDIVIRIHDGMVGGIKYRCAAFEFTWSETIELSEHIYDPTLFEVIGNIHENPELL